MLSREGSSSGFCRSCGEAHGLPAEAALPHCLDLMESLRVHRRLDFEIPEAEADPRFSTASLYSGARGKMMGILVARDGAGAVSILRAFSSKHNGCVSIPGWVPPLFDEERYLEAISAGNRAIHPLTDRINGLEQGTAEWSEVSEARKAVSREALARIYSLYRVRNFRGETRSLASALDGAAIRGSGDGPARGIPTGTGDCCAPKLLNHAARSGLRPIAMAEFFWGRESASGQRSEGRFYLPCREKCGPLLGYMLCGLESAGSGAKPAP